MTQDHFITEHPRRQRHVHLAAFMKGIGAVCLAGCLAVSGCYSLSVRAASPENAGSAADRSVEEMVQTMTLEQKIGQMIMPAFRSWGTSAETAEDVTALNDEIRSAIANYGFGGVILFAENTSGTQQTVELTNAMQSAILSPDSITQIPLLIATDQEGGSVARLATGTSLPGNMAVGATGKTEYATQSGEIIGSELSALGINVDFAPALDVNSNPANPVIEVRSFSSDPDLVSSMGTAFMEGLHNQGVACSVKHFPGHGNTQTDSHTGLPSIDSTYEQLKECDLKPFERSMSADPDIVMTAHIQFPNVEHETAVSASTGQPITLPATLSHTIITDILRNDLGYDGVVCTDALNMKAIAENFDRSEAARLAINAGVDILLMPVTLQSADDLDALEEYVQSIKAMVEQGQIDENQINDSVVRILKLKEKQGLLDGQKVYADPQNAAQIVGSQAHHDAEWTMALNAMTSVKNQDVLPLAPKENESVAFFCADDNEIQSVQYALNRLEQDGRLKHPADYSVLSYEDRSADEFAGEISSADYIVANVETYRVENMDPNSPNGTQSAFIDALLNAAHEQGKKVIVISTNLPYDLARYQQADALIAAYGAKGMSIIPETFGGETPTWSPNISAAVYSLFQPEAPNGTLPVDVMQLNSDYTYSDQVLYPLGYRCTRWGADDSFPVWAVCLAAAGVVLILGCVTALIVWRKRKPSANDGRVR